jgi:hypothetical protein
MKRREFISGVGGSAAASAWPFTALAQGDRLRRIVIPMLGPETDPQEQAKAAAFRDGLRKLGWIDSRNIKLEFFWRGPTAEAAKADVAEIVGHVPDVVVVTGLQGFLAMRREANTVPTVL